MLDIQGENGLDIYSLAARVEYRMDQPLPGTKLNAKVQPANVCVSQLGLTMSLLNKGPIDVTVADLNKYMVLDEQGPLQWGFFDRVLPLSKSAPVAVGAEAILADTLVFIDGLGTKLRILPNVGPAAAAFNMTSELQGLNRQPINAEMGAKMLQLKSAQEAQFERWTQARQVSQH